MNSKGKQEAVYARDRAMDAAAYTHLPAAAQAAADAAANEQQALEHLAEVRRQNAARRARG